MACGGGPRGGGQDEVMEPVSVIEGRAMDLVASSIPLPVPGAATGAASGSCSHVNRPISTRLIAWRGSLSLSPKLCFSETWDLAHVTREILLEALRLFGLDTIHGLLGEHN